jgi:hypothetical protein
VWCGVSIRYVGLGNRITSLPRNSTYPRKYSQSQKRRCSQGMTHGDKGLGKWFFSYDESEVHVCNLCG